ncbi:MAG: hypothetical protein KIT68_02800 [Phycisphaeraceae bacterium]|nr:hypothetical protein [Phycisphaeraceae bacterium]
MNTTNRAHRTTALIDGAGLAAIILATLVVYALFLGPRWAASAELSERTSLLEQRREEVTRADEVLRDAHERLGKVRAQADRAPVQLRRVDEINARLAALAALGESIGPGEVKLSQITPGQTARSGRFEIVPIRLSGQSAYPRFAELLTSLHASFKDTEITAIQIARDGSAPGAARFTVELAWFALPAQARGAARTVSAAPSSP